MTAPLRTLRGVASPAMDPGAADTAYLSVLTGPAAGKQFRVGDSLVLGRGAETQVALRSEDISRTHARVLRQANGEHLLEDLSSKNGTRVNGEVVTSHTLKAGDRILLGSETLLLFSRRSPEEDELLENQKLDSLARLAGGIAHDFNNLLMVITGNLQMLRLHEAIAAVADPEVAECLSDALGAAGQARDLVRQLLGFARRGRWEERPVEVGPLLGEVAALLERTLDPRITVTLEVGADLNVMGDRAQLFQMLVNLCLNSRDAMPSGGELHLAAELAHELGPMRPNALGPLVHLRVRDSGEGMEEDTRTRVFEPFFTTKNGPGRGMGLGLAVVHGIVAGHGGQVWVESELRQGSTFHVTLPALLKDDSLETEAPESALERTQAPEDNPPPQVASTRRLVLVVDDDGLVRRGIARLLRAIGYDVEMASGGASALEAFPRLRDRLAFVLLDLVMPEMDGQEVLARLLALDPDVRVVVMSGHHDEVTVERLTEAGARAFLAKPFELAQLQSVMRVLLEP